MPPKLLRPDHARSSRASAFRLAALLLAALIALTLAAAALAATGLLTRARPADVAIVLGNTVLPSGEPSPRLAARLDRAYECYAARQCRILFVSGGVDPAGADEAAVMRNYLQARGVPADRIVMDSAGNNSWATARHASAYMREHGYTSALAVTQYFHLPRTMLALRRHGVADVSGGYPRFFEWRDLYSVFRELPAVAWYGWRSL
ncbi:YdcF family protein [Achromobacter spanius]|uniref:YdcF family protein n=1 Tax=Achromobacter spanius TaxID=217203 RepID=UPI000F8FA517|nr:YdcF family protein [Achromobacter spanius]AZS81365.1 YdcF family protein [Achromobacter spanius]